MEESKTSIIKHSVKTPINSKLMQKLYTYSMTTEIRTIRCCDCKGYVNSQFASVLNSYKKECLKTRKFVYAMQNPCEKFDPFFPDNVFSIDEQGVRMDEK